MLSSSNPLAECLGVKKNPFVVDLVEQTLEVLAQRHVICAQHHARNESAHLEGQEIRNRKLSTIVRHPGAAFSV